MKNYINKFENGEIHWNELPHQVKGWYLDNFEPEEIVIGFNHGGPVTVAHLNTGGDASGETDYTRDPRYVKDTQYGQIPVGTGTGVDIYDRTTVAGLTPDQLRAVDAYQDAGENRLAALGTATDYYSGILDPNSSVVQDLASASYAGTSNPFLTAGTFGGARQAAAGQYAGNKAVLDARANAVNQLQNLDYEGGARSFGTAGQVIQDQNQRVINADINKFNQAQLKPYVDAELNFAKTNPGQTGFSEGAGSNLASGLNFGNFGSALSSLGTLANQFGLNINSGGLVPGMHGRKTRR